MPEDGMHLGLTIKVAMVAGASRGLGYAVAHMLAAEGAKVSISSRNANVVAAAIVRGQGADRESRTIEYCARLGGGACEDAGSRTGRPAHPRESTDPWPHRYGSRARVGRSQQQAAWN